LPLQLQIDPSLWLGERGGTALAGLVGERWKLLIAENLWDDPNAQANLRQLNVKILASAKAHVAAKQWIHAHEELQSLFWASGSSGVREDAGFHAIPSDVREKMGFPSRAILREARELLLASDEPTYQQANAAQSEGNWAFAARGFDAMRKSLHRSPAFRKTAQQLEGVALFNLGKEFYSERRWREAVTAFEGCRALVYDDSSVGREMWRLLAPALVQYGWLAYRQKNYRVAVEQFSLLEDVEPVSAYYHALGKSAAQRTRNVWRQPDLPEHTVALDVLPGGPSQPALVHLFDSRIGLDQVFRVDQMERLTRTAQGKAISQKLAVVHRILLTASASAVVKSASLLEQAFPGKVFWRDPDMIDLTYNISSLSGPSKPAESRWNALVLVPSNESQQAKMGLGAWSRQDLDQARSAKKLFLDRSAFMDILIPPEKPKGWWRRWTSPETEVPLKTRALRTLQDADGVVILFAHGDRNRLYLPDGTTISSTDLQKDSLRNRPVVLLFSCEGGNPGAPSEASASVADYLKEAGARAVWSFEEKVDVRESAEWALNFLVAVRSGRSLLEAIESVVREINRTKGPHVRLKANGRTHTAFAWV
jgi:tetratricopeptide (TPR) repeat protein